MLGPALLGSGALLEATAGRTPYDYHRLLVDRWTVSTFLLGLLFGQHLHAGQSNNGTGQWKIQGQSGIQTSQRRDSTNCG